jgi:hypothetical protein
MRICRARRPTLQKTLNNSSHSLDHVSFCLVQKVSCFVVQISVSAELSQKTSEILGHHTGFECFVLKESRILSLLLLPLLCQCFTRQLSHCMDLGSHEVIGIDNHVRSGFIECFFGDVGVCRSVLQITEARRGDPLTSTSLTSRAEVYPRIRKSHPKPWCSGGKMNCACIIYTISVLAVEAVDHAALYFFGFLFL